MPYPFTLPTTGFVSLSDYFSSITHPSLPFTATTKRSVLRDALKKHKRLSRSSQDGDLTAVHDALTNYIPYLLALNTASGFRDVGVERVDVEMLKPLQVEWRTTLSTSPPGREPPRAKLVGLHFEIAFVFSTLAQVHCLLARAQRKQLHAAGFASADGKTKALAAVMKHLLDARAILQYLLSWPSVAAATSAPADIRPATTSALASLALAEATLTVVSKDDPYAAAVADDRNERNTDWMYKAPTIPKVRAVLFARICLAAAEHARQAHALLAHDGQGKLNDDLIKYANDLRRTARGKAVRFFAVDAELSGKTAEALAWLRGAKHELGFAADLEEGKRKGLKGLKQSWQERRLDRKLEKGGDWGLDGGRFEEGRIVEMLKTKWERENSTVNVQQVPPFEPLLAQMPQGREYHNSLRPYQPPTLESEVWAQMRAPPDPDVQAYQGDEQDSGDEGYYPRSEPVGAFPGTAGEYDRGESSGSYY